MARPFLRPNLLSTKLVGQNEITKAKLLIETKMLKSDGMIPYPFSSELAIGVTERDKNT
jgi:hypothetical protein